MAHLLVGCAFSKTVLHAVLARAGALPCLPVPPRTLWAGSRQEHVGRRAG